MKKIDEIWFERKCTLDKLYYDIKWLIKSKKPLTQKCAIWQTTFDNFVLKSFDQDKRIRNLVKK